MNNIKPQLKATVLLLIKILKDAAVGLLWCLVAVVGVLAYLIKDN